MPFTRITLHQHCMESHLCQLSAILQQTLVEEFAVPEHDCFQIFEILSDSQFIFNRHYLSRMRSKKFILFHLVAGKPRSREQKKNFYRVLSERLFTQCGIHSDDLMVIMQFNNSDDWSFSGGKMYCPEELC
ncbi:tautomerase family protein [Erwinia sp. CGal63]|uniref:tautomerase family protein n=1 Tax=Erwinia sp. CGal63 TaxID=2919889 RepID=UPI003009E142